MYRFYGSKAPWTNGIPAARTDDGRRRNWFEIAGSFRLPSVVLIYILSSMVVYGWGPQRITYGVSGRKFQMYPDVYFSYVVCRCSD